MALPSFRLLRPYAIYRIVYVGKAPTNPAPIVFPIYIGPAGGKMHALVLNPYNISSFDVMNIVRFIKRMSRVPNAYRYNGRLMYRILRQYLPQIVSKCYRTYFSTGVKRYALISTGIVPKEVISEAEKSISDINLHQHAQKSLLVKSLNLFTDTKVGKKEIGRTTPENPPVQPQFYEPSVASNPPSRDSNLTADNSTTTKPTGPRGTIPTTPSKPTTQSDDIEGYS